MQSKSGKGAGSDCLKKLLKKGEKLAYYQLAILDSLTSLLR
jgi:hypothetical protein